MGAKVVGVEPTQPVLKTGTLPIKLYLSDFKVAGLEPAPSAPKALMLPIAPYFENL